MNRSFFWRKWLKNTFQTSSPEQARRSPRRRSLASRQLTVERLEDRIVPSVDVVANYTGVNFSQVNTINSANGGASVPPDTQGAAGPNSYIESVNGAFSIFTPKNSGSSVVSDNPDDFFFTQGALPHIAASDGTGDAFMTFDSQAQRFFVGELDYDKSSTNGDGNALLLAVSKSANPATFTSADWYFYEIKTTETGISFQDYPGNIGYNADALVITENSFSTTADVHTLVNAISIKALTSGTALTVGTNLFQTDLTSDILVRPATMPDSKPGDPMWLVAAPNNGGQTGSPPASTVDVIKMTNVLGTPTFTTTALAVNPYSVAVSPLQPNGQPMTSPGFTDSRIMNADEQNNILVATQMVSDSAGDEVSSQWYAIDVSGAAPVMQQQGDISGGPGVYITYPGIAVNATGDIGMSYMQSGTGPGQYLSVYVTGRTKSDPLGTMETPVLAQAGAGNYVETSGFFNSALGSIEYRLGDMSGIYVDSDGSFWVDNEFADSEPGAGANWGTAIVNFHIGAPPITILPFSSVEGQPIVNAAVAKFTDDSGTPLSGYSATINWGDGSTTAGKVVANGNSGTSFSVLGSHTYSEEGQYTFSVSVNNGIVTLGPASATITVADAPLSGSAQVVNGTVGTFLSGALVGVFTDSDPTNTPSDPQGDTADYSATVTLAEGNGLFATTGGQIVSLAGNTFGVFVNFPFSFVSGGLFGVAVTVRDVGGASVTINSTVNVANNPAIPPLVPFSQTDTGPFTNSFVSLEDALTNLLMSERLFMIAFAYGTPTDQQHAFGNLFNAFAGYEAAVLSYDLTLPGS
jgi:hypothetical protein